jgi:lipoic acid synthetase
LPPWIRVRLSASERVAEVDGLLRAAGLHTVCVAAHCPNRQECFGRGTATFMILGGVCTRDCRFCAVARGPATPPDADEPQRVAAAAARLKLRHVVVTSVTRDDLADGGAGHFAATIQAVRRALPGATVEVLTPDFRGREASLRAVLAAAPDVFNHNLETVRRLQARIRPEADYDRSLRILRRAADYGGGVRIKSGLMVGLGESDEELFAALADLRQAGVEIVTLGQYLAPSRTKAPVARFVAPEAFDEYRRRALALGFKAVAAGPLVRSSYRAEQSLEACRVA